MGLDRVIVQQAMPRACPVLESYRISTVAADRDLECARLHASSFAAAWDAAEFEQFLNATGTIAHGAIHAADNRLVAIVLSRVASDEADVLTLAVVPVHRRRGLARRLLAAHLADLAEAGVGALFLEVDAENAPALALYAALGFAVVGQRKDYYRSARSDPRPALVLRRDLARRERPPFLDL